LETQKRLSIGARYLIAGPLPTGLYGNGPSLTLMCCHIATEVATMT